LINLKSRVCFEVCHQTWTGGSQRSNKGGSSNYLYLPNDTDNGKPYSYAKDVLYGIDHETGGSANLSGLDTTLAASCSCLITHL
jgi:hypothetical protein